MAVTVLLLESQIEASRVLLAALDAANFGVKAAFWSFNGDQERWIFNVATDGMNEDYSGKTLIAAEIVHAWRQDHPHEDILDLADTRWIDVDDRVVVGLAQIAKLGKQPQMRLTNRYVNGVYLEDVIVHRIAA